jgi:hypothetical protein
MFDIQLIKACFSGWIGWQSSQDPCKKPLESFVTDSESGQTYNEYHPLLTPDNIESIAINPNKFIINLWDIGTNYAIGAVVYYNASGFKTYYKALAVNTGSQPDASPLDWQEVPYLSDWYEKKTNESVNKFFNAISVKKKLAQKTKTILDSFKLFKNEGRIGDLITKSNRFVGFRIQTKETENISILIKQIGVQFSQIQPNINFYLFHSSQASAISVIPITTTLANSFQWSASTLKLDYVNDDYDTGAFYLGYYEADLVGQAINKQLDWDDPCYGCQGWKISDYQSFSQFMKITPVYVSSSDLPAAGELFDIDDLKYTNNTNFGINLSLTVTCDWTSFICSHKSLFTNALGAQVANDFLNEMLFSTRDNDLREKINAAIQGNKAINSMSKNLEMEIDAIDFDMSDLGTPCMPCARQKGLRQQGI